MSLEIVTGVYARGGFDLSTKEGCGVFTEAVVIALRTTDIGWGHIRKTGAQNHVVDPEGNWHAVDALMYHADGRVFDIVSDSESPNARPAWQDKGVASTSLWYAPNGEAPPVVIPPVVIPPVVPTVDLGPVLVALDALRASIDHLRAKPDPVVKFPNYSGKVSIPFVGDRTVTLKPEA